jgi:hypothetical protein
LQSQAAHAGVSARLRRKIGVLTGKRPAPAPAATRTAAEDPMPLFPALDREPQTGTLPEPEAEALAVGA